MKSCRFLRFDFTVNRTSLKCCILLIYLIFNSDVLQKQTISHKVIAVILPQLPYASYLNGFKGKLAAVTFRKSANLFVWQIPAVRSFKMPFQENQDRKTHRETCIYSNKSKKWITAIIIKQNKWLTIKSPADFKATLNKLVFKTIEGFSIFTVFWDFSPH